MPAMHKESVSRFAATASITSGCALPAMTNGINFTFLPVFHQSLPCVRGGGSAQPNRRGCSSLHPSPQSASLTAPLAPKGSPGISPSRWVIAPWQGKAGTKLVSCQTETPRRVCGPQAANALQSFFSSGVSPKGTFVGRTSEKTLCAKCRPRPKGTGLGRPGG